MVDFGFVRVASCSPRVFLGDVDANVKEIRNLIGEFRGKSVQAVVFPELCITGYTMGDLFLQPLVQEKALEGLCDIATATVGSSISVIVGLPISKNGRLYNCGAVLQGGKICGIIPKVNLPNGAEFYEPRWFDSGRDVDTEIIIKGKAVPFAPNLLFCNGSSNFAVEICEDLWSPSPPSNHYAPKGAEIIYNLSASNALVAKHAYRKNLIAQQSGRLISAYVYAGAGYGESTSDMVFDGFCGIYENGKILAKNSRFLRKSSYAVADVDVQSLRYQRQRTGSFFNADLEGVKDMRDVSMLTNKPLKMPFKRLINKMPFVPQGSLLYERLEEIVKIQSTALATRLEITNINNMVVGISGGLDSTLCLLIAVHTADLLELPHTSIYTITMPGFGTGNHTLSNAIKLMTTLGTTQLNIPIGPAVKQHFSDIGQDENNYDVTYENSQARERTQILMDYANKVNGLVLGTGDLSEGALGFSTYNGDHMSMYNVNCSIPKTLIRALVDFLADDMGTGIKEICSSILETPVSPELIPSDDEELSQKTEEILGDYVLHDFFLYNMMYSGSSPQRLKALAIQAFEDDYEEEVIDNTLKIFVKRFFMQQFKRNCVPDGPKVGTVSLSPRGDWRMPSDMYNTMWVNELSETK